MFIREHTTAAYIRNTGNIVSSAPRKYCNLHPVDAVGVFLSYSLVSDRVAAGQSFLAEWWCVYLGDKRCHAGYDQSRLIDDDANAGV
jgi:hypothetical protein